MDSNKPNGKGKEGIAKVFLSHAFADFSAIAPVLVGLRRGGINYWICEERIPDAANIPAEINEALKQCSHLLVFWSQAASQSRVTLDEVSGFYMRVKSTGRMLFVRLDATPVPPLYAAAAYVPVGQPPAQIARRVKGWLESDDRLENISPKNAPQNPPPAHPLHVFLIGPMIEPEHLTEDLSRAFADRYESPEPADDLINRANRLRLAADPTGSRNNMLLLAGDLPRLAETSPYAFWSRALGQARRKSRRMLASLLLECDASGFPRQAADDRQKLLELLKQTN
jgi:TIR domain